MSPDSHTTALTQGYLVRHHCPCCGADAARASPAVASVPPAEALPPEKHTDFAPGYSARRVFFSYFTCPECGVRFCPVFYTEAQLRALYGDQHENMGEVPLPARRRAQEEYARCLLKHVRRSGAFLEIGPDIGLFAQYCATHGNFSHFWLLEPNRSVHEELRDRLADRPHTILEEMWPTDEVPAGSLSAVALIHVLDHLLDPLAFLRLLREKLEPDGVVMTVTHNSASRLARVLGKRWPPHALQHPQLYTPASIARLYERAGFHVEKVAPAVNYFPLMHLVRGGLSIAGLPALLPQAMGSIVPIQLGNIAVVARAGR